MDVQRTDSAVLLGGNWFTLQGEVILVAFDYEMDPHKGRIVRTRQRIPKGFVFCESVSLKSVAERDDVSFQVGWDKHIHIDAPGAVLSHSCEPNLAPRTNHRGAYTFRAVRDIRAGEELCWHYGSTEAVSIAVSECYCGGLACMGRSYGFTELTRLQQNDLVRMGVANYLYEWWDSPAGGDKSPTNPSIPGGPGPSCVSFQ